MPRNDLAIASTRVLIAAVEERLPQHWGTGDKDVSAIDGRKMVDNAFNGCVEAFYTAVKMACRNDWNEAYKLLDWILEEAYPESCPVLQSTYDENSGWYVTIQLPNHTFRGRSPWGPQAVLLATLSMHLYWLRNDQEKS